MNSFWSGSTLFVSWHFYDKVISGRFTCRGPHHILTNPIVSTKSEDWGDCGKEKTCFLKCRNLEHIQAGRSSAGILFAWSFIQSICIITCTGIVGIICIAPEKKARSVKWGDSSSVHQSAAFTNSTSLVDTRFGCRENLRPRSDGLFCYHSLSYL